MPPCQCEELHALGLSCDRVEVLLPARQGRILADHGSGRTLAGWVPRAARNAMAKGSDKRRPGRCAMAAAYICDFVRTPIGRCGGALKDVRTDDLAAHPLRVLKERNACVDWDELD